MKLVETVPSDDAIVRSSWVIVVFVFSASPINSAPSLLIEFTVLN